MLLEASNFFYIEQCYHVVPTPIERPLEKAFLQICNKLNRTTPLVKDNTTIDNNSAYNELRKICEQNIIPSYTCHLNMESSVRWIEYGVTVAFTIGEKINMNL